VEDKERAGRPKLVEDIELGVLLDEDPYQTQEELAGSSGVAQSTIPIRKSIRNDSKAKKLGTI